MEVNFSLKYVFSYFFADIQPTTKHNFWRVWQLYHKESRILPYKVSYNNLKAHSFESLEIIKFYLRKIDISL